MIVKHKINIELVPESLWYKAPREKIIYGDWRTVKDKVCEDNTCYYCGRKIDEPHCHEVYSYNENKGIQKLENLICICPDCHLIKHLGYANVTGKFYQAKEWCKKINNWNDRQFYAASDKAADDWVRRNKISWTSDINIPYLTELIGSEPMLYGINYDGIIFLKVSYERKDEAKKKGAKWSRDFKCWYITDDMDIKNFDDFL